MILSGPSILKTLNWSKSRGGLLPIHNNTLIFLVYYSCSLKSIEKHLVNYSYFGSCPRFENVSCLVNFWCMFGVGVEVWTKNIVYWFIGGQTYFNISWHIKTSLNPKWFDIECFSSQTSTSTLNMHQKLTEHRKFLYMQTINSQPNLQLNYRIIPIELE